MPNWLEAEAVKDRVEVLKQDRRGRTVKAKVPGHKQDYFVFLTRTKGTDFGVVQCFCERDDGHECLGNQESVCYHVLAVVLHGISQNKKNLQVTWFDSPQLVGDAAEGRIVYVRSNQSNKRVVALIAPPQAHADSTPV